MSYSSSTMRWEWVVGRWKGHQAKVIRELASEGIGYFVLQQGDEKKNPSVTAAFRRPKDSPLPDHLARPNREQIARLNKRQAERMGGSKDE